MVRNDGDTKDDSLTKWQARGISQRYNTTHLHDRIEHRCDYLPADRQLQTVLGGDYVRDGVDAEGRRRVLPLVVVGRVATAYE